MFFEEVEQISPWRFPAPVSPHLAGEIDPKALLDFCQTQIEQHPLTLIEGAGGVMTPLAERYTQLELMRELRLPVVLVTGSYVGTLSHTLTALEALKSAGVQVASIIVNESPDSATGLDETAQSLKAFMLFSCPVFTLPQISPTNCPWLHAPSLTEVLI
ncbi:MAG: ATP-dependent dethiobiotin synthetase BioD [Rickettsiales bacterium]